MKLACIIRNTSAPLGRCLAFVLLLLPFTVRGDGFLDDDLNYVYLGNNTARVEGLRNSSATHITIPEKVLYEYSEWDADEGKYVTKRRACTVISIVGWAFAWCSGLTGTLNIPDSVTDVGSWAFYRCSGLTKLTLGERVISIGEGAFEGCSGLTGTLDIPDSVTGIGNSAFDGCSGLTGVRIGNSVTSIRTRAFYGCNGLTGDLVIPDSVMNIGSWAFRDCSGLTRVLLGNGVTDIGYGAFDGCTGLTAVHITDLATWCNIKYGSYEGYTANCLLSAAHNLYLNGSLVTDLTIPDGVTSIGDYAFKYCSSLTSVTIPDCVTSIGSEAFSGCGNLARVMIGDSVTSIGSFAFEKCGNLATVVFEGGPPDVVWSTFIHVKSGAVGTYMAEHKAAWEAVIDSRGYWQGLKMEMEPPDVTVHFNANGGRFLDGNGNEVKDKNGNPVTVYDQYFTYGKAQRLFPADLSLQKGGEDGNVFLGWARGTPSVDSLDDLVTGREEVTWDDDVTEVTFYAIWTSTVTVSFYTDEDGEGNKIVDPSSLTNHLSWQIWRAGNYSRSFRSGESAQIAPGQTYVMFSRDAGYDAFASEFAPDSPFASGYDSLYRTLDVGSGSWDREIFVKVSPVWQCLVSFVCAGEKVAGRTFDPDMVDITLKYRGEDGSSATIVLDGFRANKAYWLPQGVYAVEARAADDRWRAPPIFSLYLSADVFGFRNVYLNFAYLGDGDSLSGKSVRLDPNASDATVDPDVLHVYMHYSSGEICVPQLPKPEKAHHHGFLGWWTDPKNGRRVKEGDVLNVYRYKDEGIRYDGQDGSIWLYAHWDTTIWDVMAGALVRLVSLNGATAVTVPVNVTSIGSEAFSDCAGLVSVTIPEKVGDIGYCAFSRCGDLASVTIGGGVTNIGDHAFSGCGSLTNMTIPASVTSIGAGAFADCTNLASVVFYGNAPVVGEAAFHAVAPGCSAYVRRSSTGWGVEIPGTWNGLNIQYMTPAMERQAEWDMAEDVRAPTFSPATKTVFFRHEQTVAISCATDAAEIRYTLDGSEPSASSLLYTGSFAITNSLTVKAKAFAEGMRPSATVQAEYVHASIVGDNLVQDTAPVHGMAQTVSVPVPGTYQVSFGWTQGGGFELRLSKGGEVRTIASVSAESAGTTNFLFDVSTAGDYELAVYDSASGTSQQADVSDLRLSIPDTPENKGRYWICETEDTYCYTGEWIAESGFRNGKMPVDGRNIFNPYTSSTGDHVVVIATFEFEQVRAAGYYDLADVMPDCTAAISLGEGASGENVFKVLTMEHGVKTWKSVHAEDMSAPTLRAPYTFKFAFDYTNRTYSVALVTNGTEKPLTDGTTGTFAFAGSCNSALKAVEFTGNSGNVVSLFGSYSDSSSGFAQGDMLRLSDGAAILSLTGRQAAWLNSMGPYETVKAKAGRTGMEDFMVAYLLNLDLTKDGSGLVTFEVSGIDVGETDVTISVRLNRVGTMQASDGGGTRDAPINGVLKLYGGDSLQGRTLLNATKVTDASFSEGDTATFTYPRSGGAKFFRPAIEVPAN